MSNPIQGVRLTCFRGASRTTEVHFDTKKALVMVFGENGTGKSTIIDAIDLVSNRRVGSLDDRSIGQHKIGFLPTIGKSRSDLAVEVLIGGSRWTGKVVGRAIDVTGDGKMPRVCVLRRSQLLKLIEAQPAQRYDALRSFIDVAAVEQCEQALRNAHRTTEAEYNMAARGLSESVQALEELWKREGSPGESAGDWAKGKSLADKDVLEARSKSCNKVLGALNDVRAKRIALENAESNARTCLNALKQVNDEITILPNLEGEQAVQLIMLLQQAQLVLAPPNAPTACPVCEQPIVVDDVRASITERMKGMTSYDELAKRRSLAEKTSGNSGEFQNDSGHAVCSSSSPCRIGGAQDSSFHSHC
jgi:DNA repair exonuclease SbcCD ATPase subunit